MITMVQSGRLGNQIFQYVALVSVARPREKILLVGFDSLVLTLEGVRAYNVPFRKPLWRLESLNYARLTPWVHRLPGLGLVQEGALGEPDRDVGRHSLCVPAWFQNGEWACANAPSDLAIRASHYRAAAEELTKRALSPERTAFVHARGGDYRTWLSRENPAILPVTWYQEQVAELRKSLPGLGIVVVGDDFHFGESVAIAVDAHHIWTGSESTDLALLALCRAGVLSASSFAFWGAWFAYSSGSAGPFIAPEFWVGHRVGQWFPPGIQAPFIDYR